MSLRGEKVSARTETTLFPGDRLSLRVEDLAGTIVLRLLERDVPEARQAGELIRSRVPQSMDVGRDYSDLRAAIQNLLQKSPSLREGPLGALLGRLEQVWPGEGASADRLKAFVESSGIFYERKLAASIDRETGERPPSDLKTLILEAKVSAKDVPEGNPGLRGDLEKFLDISEKVLKNTELVQLANSLMNTTESTFWTVLPYGDGEKADSVDWEVRRGGRDEGSEEASFSLSFNLSGLGRVKVDGLFSGNRLHCHFWGQDEETVRFVEDHLAEFSHAAETKGMVVGSLVCGVAQGIGGTPLQKIMRTAGIRLVDRQA